MVSTASSTRVEKCNVKENEYIPPYQDEDSRECWSKPRLVSEFVSKKQVLSDQLTPTDDDECLKLKRLAAFINTVRDVESRGSWIEFAASVTPPLNPLYLLLLSEGLIPRKNITDEVIATLQDLLGVREQSIREMLMVSVEVPPTESPLDTSEWFERNFVGRTGGDPMEWHERNFAGRTGGDPMEWHERNFAGRTGGDPMEWHERNFAGRTGGDPMEWHERNFAGRTGGDPMEWHERNFPDSPKRSADDESRQQFNPEPYESSTSTDTPKSTKNDQEIETLEMQFQKYPSEAGKYPTSSRITEPR